MNFMPPDLAETSNFTELPVPAQKGLGLTKLIALVSVAILTLLGTAAWLAFLVRIAWSIF
jgi:hypothetical protein